MVAIYVPLQMGRDWVDSPGSLFCLIVPLMLVGMTIPESFAGERERHTLATLLASLGVAVASHAHMPDVVLYHAAKNRLLLIESATSHGPIDEPRRAELASLFAGSTAGLLYVTAFPNRATMARSLADIAWETEVWVADAPALSIAG